MAGKRLIRNGSSKKRQQRPRRARLPKQSLTSRPKQGSTPSSKPRQRRSDWTRIVSRLSDVFIANKAVIRFVLSTALILVMSYFVLKVPSIERHFVDPYTHFVAACSRLCLRLIGVQASGAGSTIVAPEFSVTIKNVCNGLEVAAIFLAATVGFPATWKSRCFALLLGLPAIFLVNLVRIMVLFVLGFKVPDVFEAVHFYYAQVVVIIVTVALWLLWATTFSAYGSKSRHRFSS